MKIVLYCTLQSPAVQTIAVKQALKYGAKISMKMAISFKISANNLKINQ